MDIGHLQIAGNHFLVVFETAAGQNHTAVDLDLHVSAVLVDDHTDHSAFSVGNQLLTGSGEPHVDGTGFHSFLAQVVVAAVEAGTGSSQAQAVLAGGDFRELSPVVIPVIGTAQLVGVGQVAFAAVSEFPVLIGGFHAGRGMIGRRNNRSVAAHGAGHPGIVLNAAFAVSADSVGIPVLELAHQGGQVLIQSVSIIGSHNELTGNCGVSAFSAFGGFFSQQHFRALLKSSNSSVGTGSAVTQHNYVILRVPRDFFISLCVTQVQSGAGNSQPCGTNGSALQE